MLRSAEWQFLTEVSAQHFGLIFKVHEIMDSFKNTGKQEIMELKKTAVLNAALTLRSVLMLKYKTLNNGNNITWAKNYNYRMVAKLCMVGFRYKIVATLHKADNE